MKSILLLNGPNLNLLGTREKEIYGSLTLEEIESNLLEIAKNNSINLSCFQSNAEHELIDAIHEAYQNKTNKIIFNPFHLWANCHKK